MKPTIISKPKSTKQDYDSHNIKGTIVCQETKKKPCLLIVGLFNMAFLIVYKLRTRTASMLISRPEHHRCTILLGCKI
jgi:hypothetical protein